jgi:hypothetical protein
MPKTKPGPPLKFERRETKKWGGELEVSTIEMIEAYPEYHKQATGEEAPKPGEVVDQIVKKVLGSHTEFKKFLEERRTSAGGGGGKK